MKALKKNFFKTLLATIGLMILIGSNSVEATTGENGLLKPLPRVLEIQLALSALPPHLRDSATVYVLNVEKGYEVAREGNNGFHTFVGRNEPAFLHHGPEPYTEYRDDILLPISFDEAGAQAEMRVYFDMAEMQATGTPASEAKRIIKERFETGYYKAPERVGISYMLSPVIRAYLAPYNTNTVLTGNMPHYMVYAPNVSNEDSELKCLAHTDLLLIGDLMRT